MSLSSVSLQLDPLLNDLTDKKQSFRNNVVLLASELKDTRNRLASKEESLLRESLNRKIAEVKARSMEQEVGVLKRCLEERDGQLLASTSEEEHFRELDDLRSQLCITQATAQASAASAQSAQEQYLSLLKELDEKNISLKEHEIRVNNLSEQINILQNDLEARELSQKQLKDEVMKMEEDIMRAIAQAGVSKDSELQKVLGEVSPRNIENISKHLKSKDDELARLSDELRVLSAHWKLKTKEFESQLEKHRRADQELKKRIVKLEFCLQEARVQTRKLQRMGERRDNAINELKEQLSMKQLATGKQNFWESVGFKVIVSMSMLVLVVFSRR